MLLTKLASRKYYHKPPGNPNLSPIKVNEILRKTEASWKYPNSVLHRADVSSCAANQPIEDAHFQTILNNGSACFGILDGHWTNDCSKLVAYALPLYIEKYIKDTNIKTSLKEAYEQLDSDILRLPWKSFPILSKSLQEIESIDPKQKLQTLLQCLPTFSGSCAITANLYQNDLFVAHAGDCRAILGIRDGTRWVGKVLTQDHQPSNLRELSRLNQDHPGEEETVAFNAGDGPWRVLGGMMPSRAFGDARYKWSLKEQDKIDALLANVPVQTHSWLRPPHLKTPPYLTATPEIAHASLNENVGFLVLASDGLFDVFSNSDVIQEVSRFLEKPTERTDSNVATHLIRAALSYGKGHQYLSRMLSLSPGLARRWRDDITIQVIMFQSVSSKISNENCQVLQNCS